ncbi:hypothetical protein SVAN01_00548 [Stagonosporopsis vannaccii]|nr:hypothetical protein SVAN01_00548 [Stagonosporopsis vannaccii]
MSLSFDLISTAYPLGLLLLAAASLTLFSSAAGRYFKKSIQSRRPSPKEDAKATVANPEDAYYNIVPLSDFDLETEEPIKARPFKPKFHMTMAIENTTLSDLITMDKTYQSRIALRRDLIATQHHEVIGHNPRASPAVHELYTWLTQTYLPTRFPTIYTATPTGLFNTTTAETLPRTPSSTTHALELLGSHIDTEFLVLLPSTNAQDAGKYRLEAFVTCFPSGFRTRSKLGLLLAAIHGPVPHYAQKLEKSMDRFFAALEVGKIVKRWNWTVSTSGDWFCVAGNHASEEEVRGGKSKEEQEGGQQKVDLRTTFVRCERQTLHRLPGSGAVVFAFKTYQYPIQELRDEGSGEALCEAIDGMGTGSAPLMTVYKRQVVWGEKVKAFLRGEIEIDG